MHFEVEGTNILSFLRFICKMEILGLISVPLWLVVLLVITLSLYLYTTYKQSYFRRLRIPGPKPVPFLGVLPELRKKGSLEMDIDLVKRYGKCFGVFIGNAPSLMVSDPEMIKQICIKEFANFTNRSEIIRPPDSWRNSLISAVDDHWKFLRGTLSPTFSTGKMRNMCPILDGCLDTFIHCLDEKLDEMDTVDLQKMFTALTMDFISRVALGIDVNAQNDPNDTFVRKAYKVFDIQMGRNPLILLNFLFPELKMCQGWFNFNFSDKEAGEFIETAVQKAVDDRRNDPEQHKYKDFLALMINAHKIDKADYEEKDEDVNVSEKRPLTDAEILANASAMFLAGHDSTATLLTWIAYCLAENADVQHRLIAEIDEELGDKKPVYDNVMHLPYLDMVVNETLRLYTPNRRNVRDTARDITICGIKIPKGTDVTIPVHAVHRNPEFWPNPEQFDPERFSPANKDKIVPYSYMPFGIGPRNCVGMRLALAEAKITIVKLLQHVRLCVSEKTEIPPKLDQGIVLKPLNGMWLKLVKRDQR